MEYVTQTQLWRDIIKMELKEICYVGVNWTEIAQDMIHCGRLIVLTL
jgi:hypothetical protein